MSPVDRARFLSISAALAACSKPPADAPAAATVAVPPEPAAVAAEPERPASVPGPPDGGDPGVEGSTSDDGPERPADIRASIEPPLVVKALRSAQPALRACYRNELAKTPDFDADLVLELTIVSGRVVSVDFVQSSTSPGFDVCIDMALRTLAFPAAPDGGKAVVRLPLRFKAT